MKLGLFYDTETTGIPDWHNPSDGEQQPHLVQLAAKLVDLETYEALDQMNVIVKPEGWVIPQDVIDIHGISNEKAMEEGIGEVEAVSQFLDMWLKHKDHTTRIGHNESFDARLIRIATKRYPEFDDSIVDGWKDFDRKFCTMWKSLGVLKLPPTPGMKRNGRFRYKQPKLSEAYEYFTGKPLENAHDALVDVDACVTVYRHLIQRLEAAA